MFGSSSMKSWSGYESSDVRRAWNSSDARFATSLRMQAGKLTRDRPKRSGGRPSIDRPDGHRRPQRRRRSRAAPEPRGRAVRARRRAAVGHRAAGADHRRAPPARGLLPRGARPDLPGHARPPHGRRAGRRAHARRAPQAGRPARARRRPRRRRPARRLGPRRRQRPPVRAHRARERDAAAPPARLLRDPASRALPRGVAARAGRPRRALDPRGRPRGPPQGLPRDQRPALQRARQARAAVRRGPLDHRHPLGLRGPRPHHRRLPGRQPDRPGRAPGHGQVPGRLLARVRPGDRRAPRHRRRRRGRRAGRGGRGRGGRAGPQAAAGARERGAAQRRPGRLPPHDPTGPAGRRHRQPSPAHARRLARGVRARARSAHRGSATAAAPDRHARRCPTTRWCCWPR